MQQTNKPLQWPVKFKLNSADNSILSVEMDMLERRYRSFIVCTLLLQNLGHPGSFSWF